MEVVDLVAGHRGSRLGGPADGVRGPAPVRGRRYRFRGDSICTSQRRGVSRWSRTARWSASSRSSTRTPNTRALASGETYMVGSLARLKLWGDRLDGRASAGVRTLFPDGVEDNVLLNNWAQLVEIVHSVEHGDRGLRHAARAARESKREMVDYEVRAGRGVGAVEVPRGTLFHEYELDDEGRVEAANVVTPTAQNLANIETRPPSGRGAACWPGSDRPDDAPSSSTSRWWREPTTPASPARSTSSGCERPRDPDRRLRQPADGRRRRRTRGRPSSR